jgi:shikimate dehydrogenase
VFWIVRDIEKLVTDGRPLSKDLDTVKKLYLERKDLYQSFAGEVIDNNQSLENTVKGVMDKL